jgi:signal transduction histidine kinase/ligand-binding sensor domain-containing protein
MYCRLRNFVGLLSKIGWMDLILTLAVQVPAKDFHHTAWTSDNGLGAVFDIQQSSEGYLWLTTSKGVLRFDGVRFQSLDEATNGAVHASDIDSVFLSPSGGLWLSTEGAGLLRWKDGKLSTFPDRRCTPVRREGKLVEDRNGSLWVQAAAGLFHLSGSVCEQAGTKQGYTGGFAAGLVLDREGTLWVKTRSGPLVFLSPGQSKFQTSEYAEGATASYAFLHQAPDGAIWLSDDDGLRRLTGTPKTSAPRKSSKVSAPFGDFTFSPDGSLWAATSKGVRRFDRVDQWPTPAALETAPGESFTPETGLSSNVVWKVLIDREGLVWVATNSGLDRLRRSALSTLALPPAQEHEFGIAAGDQSSVWIGNANLPLTHVAADGSSSNFSKISQILCLRRDHNGSIWSAGVGNLWKSTGTGFSPVHFPDEDLDTVVSVAVDRNHDPWITTRSGRAYHFTNGSWSNQNEALGKKPGVIGAMVDDAAGNVWFAFSNKVVQWDGSAFHRFSFPDGTRGVSETTMSVRGDRVWLAGPGGIQLCREGSFHIMHRKNTDLPGRVSGVVETGTGDLWANGFSGITHVSATELSHWLRDPSYAVSAEHFDELDGLPGLSAERLPEPSVVEAADGRLWFATTKGVAWLDPVMLEKSRNRLPPPVVISSVIANGKTYTGSSVTLPARTENLEVDYTGLSLAIPERMQFRYRLEGVDNDWQNAGTRRQAFYTKLRPGPYRFRVIASNDAGVWNEAGATLGLTVAPAWFQTSWFLILCAASSLLLISGLYRLRIRQIAARMNARFDERMAERTRIAQDLHDTLLQGFLSASMQVHMATDSLPGDSPIRPALARALETMSQVIEEGRNAVRGLRSAPRTSLDLEHAFARIQKEVDTGAASVTPVEFRVVAEGEQRILHPLLRDEVYRIGREAVINAFRHSHATRVEVALLYSSHELCLTVRDNGCGIDPEVVRSGREGHWGLSGMRERAERIGARLKVFASPASGTEIELAVPGHIAFQDKPRRGLFKGRQPEPQNEAGA